MKRIWKVSMRSPRKGRTHGGAFRFYIHDGVDACRFQILGNLTSAHVNELTGCWNTARVTLESRKLVLDLQALQSTDEAGREWLLGMVREGASCVPETYFRQHLADRHLAEDDGSEQTAILGQTRRTGAFARIWLFVRGHRSLPVESSSSTRAQ